MKSFAGFLGVLYILLVLAAVSGWVMNVFKLIDLFTSNVPIDTLFIGRIIGVPFGPLGAVLGYF